MDRSSWRATLSQPRSYPRSFGRAVAALAEHNLHPTPPADWTPTANPAAAFDFLHTIVGEDLWDDAQMSDVLQYPWKNKHLRLDF